MDMFPVHQVWQTILQGTVKRGTRQGRQKKRREDNTREWTGPEFAKSQRAVENKEKQMEETGCEVICGALTTTAVKGYVKVKAVSSSSSSSIP